MLPLLLLLQDADKTVRDPLNPSVNRFAKRIAGHQQATAAKDLLAAARLPREPTKEL